MVEVYRVNIELGVGRPFIVPFCREPPGDNQPEYDKRIGYHKCVGGETRP